MCSLVIERAPHDPAKTNKITDKFKSTLTEFGAGGLQRAVIVSEDHHRCTSLSHTLGTKQLRLPSAPKATTYHSSLRRDASNGISDSATTLANVEAFTMALSIGAVTLDIGRWQRR